jgi:hypothetical protein
MDDKDGWDDDSIVAMGATTVDSWLAGGYSYPEKARSFIHPSELAS